MTRPSTTPAPRRPAKEWARLVAAWKRSGQSREDFAASRGLSAATLTWWAWRLGHPSPSRPHPTKARSSAKKRPALKLVEVALQGGATHVASGWELRTPDGVHLTVHGPISADAIAILIGASRRRE